MIGKLKGTVDEIGEDHVIIDVHGVGYVAFCSARTLGNLPGAGEAVGAAHRDLCARGHDPAVRLPEPVWSANGSGCCRACRASAPRWRWRCLSTLPPSDLANAIALRDIAMVSRAPGVGKKVAERIVTELKNKAPAFAGEASGTIGLKQELGEGVAPRRSPMPSRR